jgi:hypothetical protein
MYKGHVELAHEPILARRKPHLMRYNPEKKLHGLIGIFAARRLGEA